MKIINCDQRSDEWYQIRLGKWTASFFDKAITTSGKPSSSANAINNKLVAEKIIGEPEPSFTSAAMERGKELEQEAIDFLNFTHRYGFEEVGFCDSGEGYGASPDSIAEDIGLELKCPLAHTHIQYLTDQALPRAYFQQVQGQMLVTGFSKWVFCSYHPDFPPLHIVVERDYKFCEALKRELVKNVKIISERIEVIKKLTI